MALYAGVRLIAAPYAVDRLYDYKIPPPLSGVVLRGRIVIVPFGGGNRRSYGLVTEVRDTTEAVRLKSVMTVLPSRYALSEEGVLLAEFLAEHTLSSLGDCVRAMLPSCIFSGVSEVFRLAGTPMGDADFFNAFMRREAWSDREILDTFGEDGMKKVRTYTASGVLTSEAEPLPPENIRKKKYYSLALPDGARVLLSVKKPSLRSHGQRVILSRLLSIGESDADTLLSDTDATPAQLRALVAKGLVSVREVEWTRNPYAMHTGKTDTGEILLSRAQGAAYTTLSELLHRETAAGALLYGVTGSGKTKVMMKLIDETLSCGKTAIMLIPEIALTPQTVMLFCRRYGDRVAVIHSSLGVGERFDAWRRIRDGEVDLVIGTRSAIFAPLENIGLILIDEEHEHTYKSDQNPKYHARDVAAFRAGKHAALMLLASATPSVESYYKAERGVYTLVSLTERFGAARLPETVIVDMREELRRGNRSPISERLLSSLRETHENGEQAVLFLNRRGYNGTVSCHACGEPILCPHCSVSLTYHIANGGYLLCHYCGHKSFVPRECPSCKSQRLSYLGCGTEKAESELSAVLPDMAVLRMDADTVNTRDAYERILTRFREGDGDILLGTQMVTKGHDFPRVTLSGVLLADTSLHVNDFRASERTFSLLTQVVGRAGRRDTQGVAVIQTYQPQHPVILLAAKQDYVGFYKQEIALRKSLTFPPFCDLVQITLSDEDETRLLREGTVLAKRVESLAKARPDMPLLAFGPFEAETYKVGGRFRLRMVLKCRLGKETRAFLAELMRSFAEDGGKTGLSVDLNPSYV